MKGLVAMFCVIAVSGCVSAAPGEATGPRTRGQELVETHCGGCHATGRADPSPAPEAPAFRELWRNYRVATLEEALAEGVSVGHPAMPEFQFAPDDAAAIIAYLESIQSEEQEQ